MRFIMGIQERKRREKERRKQQIMVAAKRVFTTKGFGRATMEDIANEAELSPGTLYLYFKSKDELCASLSLRVLEYLLLRIEHLQKEKGLDDRQKISELKKALLDVYEFDPLMLKNLSYLKSSEALSHLNSELMDEIERLSCKALQRIAAIFQAGIDCGVCLDCHSATMAAILWATFYGIILWNKGQKESVQEKAFVEPLLDRAFQIFERGILA